jgi:uncharacterized protein (UPF0147 family)
VSTPADDEAQDAEDRLSRTLTFIECLVDDERLPWTVRRSAVVVLAQADREHAAARDEVESCRGNPAEEGA